MRKTSITYKVKVVITVFFFLTSAISCTDFVQVDLPNSQITAVKVFNSDETAIAASNAMYNALLQGNGFAGGTVTNITYLSGLSSDELTNYSTTVNYREFYDNSLNIANPFVLSIWSSAYNTIYEANAVVEGVDQSTKLTEAMRKQLKGEALFIRAFCHFYLLNLFGSIPIVTGTDYRINAGLPRSPVSLVYDQILTDLTQSKMLLSESYFTPERIRPNKWSASALMARVLLYNQQYEAAELESTDIINNITVFELEPELENVFLVDSKEAIWQLSQTYPQNFPTGDGAIFIMTNNFFTKSLSENLIDAFEDSDQRLTKWTGTRSTPSGTYYYPFKYKTRVVTTGTPFPEYLMILRLAEQYLIRAEARAQLNNLLGAIDDVDKIRDRAGLPLISDLNPSITQTELVTAIQLERRVELFCELGHRWLDLKRTGQVSIVLEPLKPAWTNEDALYPVPESELLKNQALLPQNAGY
jgi:hypothetical protein